MVDSDSVSLTESVGTEADIDSETDETDDEPGPSAPKKQKVLVSRGAAKYKTKFQQKWRQKWPFASPNKNDPHSFICSVCNKAISCGHQGERDVSRHADTASHKHIVEELKRNHRLSFRSTERSQSAQDKVTRAEVKVANFIVEHNLPLAVSDHLSPLLRDIFPDSETAKYYASCRTKTTSIVNHSLAPHFKSLLVNSMRSQPFTICIDGSNDTGIEKMNPMTIRYFSDEQGAVVTHLLDMCITTGEQAATAQSIFSKMDETLNSNGVSWQNCVGVGVDNTLVNLGKRNSIRTRVLQENPAAFFMGCPCHIVHNMASKASESFTHVSTFDVEELMVDNYYFFDKSTKRKSGLAEYCTFCDVEYRRILKYVSTRWLSLETAVDRTLRQYPALRSYFLSESSTCDRFDRLSRAYSNPITEVYLLFYQAALQPFLSLNKFLQRGEPIIPVVYKQLHQFTKKLLGKFVTVSAIRSCDGDLSTIDFEGNQLPDTNLYIGLMTKQLLSKLEHEGDITRADTKRFYSAVRSFYVTALQYAFANLPLDDPLLQSSQFVDFKRRDTCEFSHIEFFVARYPTLLPYGSPRVLNLLQEEYLDYQLMDNNEIPDRVWQAALVRIDEEEDIQYHRMDIIWASLALMCSPDGRLRFSMLSNVAKLVLVLPHSNAEEERLFSMVRKNKTAFRPNLRLDGTLSSVLTVKLANTNPCHKFEPTKSVLDIAKKATKEYNRAHSKS